MHSSVSSQTATVAKEMVAGGGVSDRLECSDTGPLATGAVRSPSRSPSHRAFFCLCLFVLGLRTSQRLVERAGEDAPVVEAVGRRDAVGVAQDAQAHPLPHAPHAAGEGQKKEAQRTRQSTSVNAAPSPVAGSQYSRTCAEVQPDVSSVENG